MTTFPFVEDYIECIAGVKTSHLHLLPVALARYDRSPILSFVSQIGNNIGFTDKQSQLALRLITTYKRQLANNGIDASPVLANPQFKIPIRVIDRSMSAILTDTSIELKFPFNAKHVDLIREFAETSEGAVKFDHDARVWRFALTESCVNFAVALGKSAGFFIQPTLDQMSLEICAEEASEYDIILQRDTNDQLTIANASPPLLGYIDNNGGLVDSNLLWLVDMSEKLGYHVSKEISAEIQYPSFALSHSICLEKHQLKKLVAYAHLYNKFPIVSHVHSMPAPNEEINAFFDPSEIVNVVRGTPSAPVTSNTKVIHIYGTTYKLLPQRIPLLLCYTNMMYGGYKSLLLQSADKVCYYCDYYFKKT